jgi:hypothetical protein
MGVKLSLSRTKEDTQIEGVWGKVAAGNILTYEGEHVGTVGMAA